MLIEGLRVTQPGGATVVNPPGFITGSSNPELKNGILAAVANEEATLPATIARVCRVIGLLQRA
jgi:hypothetical protein